MLNDGAPWDGSSHKRSEPSEAKCDSAVHLHLHRPSAMRLLAALRAREYGYLSWVLALMYLKSGLIVGDLRRQPLHGFRLFDATFVVKVCISLYRFKNDID